MDIKDIIKQASAGGFNNFGTVQFNDIHDNENVYVSELKPQEEQPSKGASQPHSRPSALQLTSTQQQAFALAIERGYMSDCGDGTYHWRLSKVLLAYFLGRLFCGDYVSRDNVAEREEWISGGKDYPEAQLASLFDAGNVAANRRTRLGKAVPEGYEKIEGVIGEIE